jgi:formylglycine-generating enzyme required for sulfatase activity
VQETVVPHAVETGTRVFISYSRKDMAFADRLEAALKARDFEVLIDRTEIYAFEDWWKRIEALIGQADTIVFVLSPDAVKSEVAVKEVAYAASLNKRFAPIVCRRVEDTTVPDELRRLNFIFFDDPERFEASADMLANALETDINWIRQHTEYGQAERRWSSAGRPNGLLLQPPTLDLAEYWLASRPRNAPEPTEEIRSYVIASRKQTRASQRLWRAVVASILTLLVGIILGLVGWINQSSIVAQWRWWMVTRPYMLSQVRPYVLSVARERALKPRDNFKECAHDCPDMIVIPGGSFTMGSPNAEQAHRPREEPQHAVTFAKPFAVSKFEVAFADWDACISGGGCNEYRPNDQGWGRGQQPVINVSWDDAQQYVAWLSLVTGKTYRLLSEAEYEYAARAGTTTVYPWGDEIGKNNASCNGCGSAWDNKQPAPVGSFPANKFGLYDIIGNVWEWPQDCWHDNYNGAPTDDLPWIIGGDCNRRVERGASWDWSTDFLRSATRSSDTTVSRDGYLGFRVARTLDKL